jgi:hypothetical protein
MKLLHWLLAGLSFGALFGKHELPHIERRGFEPTPPRKPGIMLPAGFFGTAYVTLPRLRVSTSGTVTPPASTQQ